MAYTKNKLTIKYWAEEDRPREKMLRMGHKNLSDAELLAILLGSGSTSETALGLAKRILAGYNHNLVELGTAPISELVRFNGIGPAKAVTIAAALELGRRRNHSTIQNRPVISSSQDAYNIIAPMLLDIAHEEFWMITLNRGNRVMGRERISIGGVSATVVDAKVIFKRAIETSATSIILAHNHPSGNNYPSQTDIAITKQIKEAGKHLDIQVADHLIIADKTYYSFADAGMLK